MPPAVTRARVPSGNIDSNAAWCVSRATLPPATLPPAGAVSELAELASRLPPPADPVPPPPQGPARARPRRARAMDRRGGCSRPRGRVGGARLAAGGRPDVGPTARSRAGHRAVARRPRADRRLFRLRRRPPGSAASADDAGRGAALRVVRRRSRGRGERRRTRRAVDRRADTRSSPGAQRRNAFTKRKRRRGGRRARLGDAFVRGAASPRRAFGVRGDARRRRALPGRPGPPHRGHGAAREGDARRNDRRARRERASRTRASLHRASAVSSAVVGDCRLRTAFDLRRDGCGRRVVALFVRRGGLRRRRTKRHSRKRRNVETNPQSPAVPGARARNRARVFVGGETRGRGGRAERGVTAGQRARAVPRVHVLPDAKTGRGDKDLAENFGISGRRDGGGRNHEIGRVSRGGVRGCGARASAPRSVEEGDTPRGPRSDGARVGPPRRFAARGAGSAAGGRLSLAKSDVSVWRANRDGRSRVVGPAASH